MLTESITTLQEELSSAKQRHQVELWETEERFKTSNQRALHTRTTAHKEEVSALMQEWNQERKVISFTPTLSVSVVLIVVSLVEVAAVYTVMCFG